MDNSMSANVKAAMRAWGEDQGSAFGAAFDGIPRWAFEQAATITEAIVPQVAAHDTRNMLYQLPAGVKTRLTAEIAHALVAAREQGQ